MSNVTMLNGFKNQRAFEAEPFDMTPVIDVVFLLIIFFMLVCQFIAAEQFHVQVPDKIESAQQTEPLEDKPVTITVMAQSGQAVYAVGSKKLADVSGADLDRLIYAEINRLLSNNPTSEKIVRLRCDKAVTFGQVKHVLAGISKSNTATLDWAVIGE